jgi:hypothetical protein
VLWLVGVSLPRVIFAPMFRSRLSRLTPGETAGVAKALNVSLGAVSTHLTELARAGEIRGITRLQRGAAGAIPPAPADNFRRSD